MRHRVTPKPTIGLNLGICHLCIRAVFVAAKLKAGGIKIFKRRGSRQQRFNVYWLDGVNNAKKPPRLNLDEPHHAHRLIRNTSDLRARSGQDNTVVVIPGGGVQHELGEKGCVAGQGELKKVGKDPLFHINHTLAMLRANINRLFRRTWCTTKDPERLKDHLAIYTWVHNNKLIPQQL